MSDIETIAIVFAFEKEMNPKVVLDYCEILCKADLRSLDGLVAVACRGKFFENICDDLLNTDHTSWYDKGLDRYAEYRKILTKRLKAANLLR